MNLLLNLNIRSTFGCSIIPFYSLSVLHQNLFHLVFKGQFLLFENFYLHLILRSEKGFLFQFFQLFCELSYGPCFAFENSSFSLINLSINSSSLVAISPPFRIIVKCPPIIEFPVDRHAYGTTQPSTVRHRA